MKKSFVTILACLLAICSISLAACGESKKVKVLKEISLTSEEYAYIVQKGNAELVASVNELLTEMDADGSLDTLINSYFDGSATFSYTNATSSPAEGDLIVATNAYFPPFEYITTTGKFTGVDIEIAHKLAEKLNKTLYVNDMNFDAIFTSVSSGESAIGMAGITYSEDRALNFDFSKGYYESSQVLTVLEDNTEFDACTTAEEVEAILAAQGKNFIIGTQSATVGYMYAAGDASFGFDGFANLTVQSYDTGALAIRDLINGKISAVILDMQPSIMIADSFN